MRAPSHHVGTLLCSLCLAMNLQGAIADAQTATVGPRIETLLRGLANREQSVEMVSGSATWVYYISDAEKTRIYERLARDRPREPEDNVPQEAVVSMHGVQRLRFAFGRNCWRLESSILRRTGSDYWPSAKPLQGTGPWYFTKGCAGQIEYWYDATSSYGEIRPMREPWQAFLEGHVARHLMLASAGTTYSTEIGLYQDDLEIEGKQTVIGHDCFVLVSSKSLGPAYRVQQRWWICPILGYMVLRWEDLGTLVRDPHVGYRNVAFVAEITTGGEWPMPKRSTIQWYVYRGGRSDGWATSQTMIFDAVDVNQPESAHYFQFAFPLGTKVADRLADTVDWAGGRPEYLPELLKRTQPLDIVPDFDTALK